MVVRELLALLGFKVDKKSARAAEAQIDMLKKSATRLAGILLTGAAAKAFFNLVQNTAALGDETAKTAQKLGVSVVALQELRHAAALSNVSNEDLTTGLRFLARNAFEASTGSKEMQKDFARLGVTVTDAHGKLKPAEQLFTEMSDGLKGLKSETERTALAQSLFGRGGSNLIPLLLQGSAAIREQRMEAHALGAVMDAELIAMSEEYLDTQDRLKAVWQGIKNIIAKELIPVFDRMGKRTIAWVKANRELLKQRIAQTLDRVVRVVRAFVQVTSGAIKQLSEWVKQLPPLSKGLLLVAGAALVLAVILAHPVLLLGLLLALIALVIEDFKVWREGGISVIGDLIAALDDILLKFGVVGRFIREGAKVWKEYVAIALNALGSIIEFVNNVFAIGIRLAWKELIKDTKQVWMDVTDFIENRLRFIKTLIPDMVPDWLVSAAGIAAKQQLAIFRGGSLEDVANAGRVESRFSPSTIYAGARAGAAAISQAITTTASITVNAAPGMSVQAVADAVVQKIDQVREKDNRTAAAAFAPVGAR
jgi:hypothetical protein